MLLLVASIGRIVVVLCVVVTALLVVTPAVLVPVVTLIVVASTILVLLRFLLLANRIAIFIVLAALRFQILSFLTFSYVLVLYLFLLVVENLARVNGSRIVLKVVVKSHFVDCREFRRFVRLELFCIVAPWLLVILVLVLVILLLLLLLLLHRIWVDLDWLFLAFGNWQSHGFTILAHVFIH